MIQHDIDLFYWINHHHTPWLDWVMWVASQGWSWAIVLVAAVVYLSVSNKNRGSHSSPPHSGLDPESQRSRIKCGMRGEVARRAGGVCLGIGLCFLLSDRISVLCFKEVFCRLRPCHALEDVRMFHTSCGGAYGFVSSHAANVFALALFLVLWHRKHTPPARWATSPNLGEEQLPQSSAMSEASCISGCSPKLGELSALLTEECVFRFSIFAWAFLVCYSRPYLGKHYPGDVVCGALLGLAVGTAVFFLVQYIEKLWNKYFFQKKIHK